MIAVVTVGASQPASPGRAFSVVTGLANAADGAMTVVNAATQRLATMARRNMAATLRTLAWVSPGIPREARPLLPADAGLHPFVPHEAGRPIGQLTPVPPRPQ